MTSIDELLVEGRAFLDAHCPRRPDSDEQFVWGEGSDRVNILEEVDPARGLGAAGGRQALRRGCASMPGSAGSTGRSSTAAGG